MRSEIEVDRAVEQYSDMIKRICLYHLKNAADTEDVFQTVFLKYLLYEGSFEGPEHEKAWLIKVAQNRCIDMQRFRFRHPQVELSEITASYESPEYSDVLAQLIALPAPVKAAVYLYYIEGYKTAEVSEIMGISVNAVKKRLQRGRKLLRQLLQFVFWRQGF